MSVFVLSVLLHHQTKTNNIMTTQEIYQLANETTEAQFQNLFNSFTEKETTEFNILVKLGDKKELALWTVISERYNQTNEEFYKTAYNF